MIDIHELEVSKRDRTICSVSELTVAAGERVAILGENGSGKTTLMRVLSGLESDYRGQVEVNAPRKQRIYVQQSPYLFRGTVLSNVVYGLQGAVKRAAREDMAVNWLSRLGVEHLAHKSASHLSGGERRRVALARAMILQPRVLLLDEPLSDMDKKGADAICESLAQLTDSTILIASPTPLRDDLASREFRLCIADAV